MQDKPNFGFYKRPIWTLKKAPSFVSSEILDETKMKSLGIFSIPTYSYLLDVGMDEIDYDKIFIKFKQGLDMKTAKKI